MPLSKGTKNEGKQVLTFGFRDWVDGGATDRNRKCRRAAFEVKREDSVMIIVHLKYV